MKSLFAAALIAVCASSVPASADPYSDVTYLIDGVYTGTLDGQNFFNSIFTFTGVGDKFTVHHISHGGDALAVDLTSLSAVSGDASTFGVTYNLLGNYSFFVNQTEGVAGFMHTGGDDILDLSSSYFKDYYPAESFYPTVLAFKSGGAFETDQGEMVLTDGIFTLFFAHTGVPEASTWSLAITGMMIAGGALRSRRRAAISAGL